MQWTSLLEGRGRCVHVANKCLIWKQIIAVIDATSADVKRKPEKKNQACTVLNPWPLRYGAAVAPHHYTLKNPAIARACERALTLQAFSRQLETGDGIFFHLHATPVWLYNDGSTPGVRPYPFWLWKNITQEDGSPIVYNRSSWGKERQITIPQRLSRLPVNWMKSSTIAI